MTLDFTEQRRQLSCLVGDGAKTETLQSCAIQIAKVQTLIAIHMPSAGDQWSPGPEGLCVFNGNAKRDHIGARNNFVQDGEWPGSVGLRRAFAFPRQQRFDLDLAQAIDQSLDTDTAQRFD